MLAEVLAQREREYAEDVAAVQEGVNAVNQGRVRPAAEFFAEHRLRYPNAELLK